MIWGDRKLKRYFEELIINGNPKMINPASINLCLGNSFLLIGKKNTITLGETVEYNEVIIADDGGFILESGGFCLATTKEGLVMFPNVAAFVQGRSSIGRIGLTVQNAGFVDPGFMGHITLELKNDAPVPIVLKPGYPVAQLVFFDCTAVKHPYKGKYNGQINATGSRMFMDKEKYGDLFKGGK
mgnify:CR=1 FL=1